MPSLEMSEPPVNQDTEANKPTESDVNKLHYQDPFKFSNTKKWTITALFGLCAFTCTFCSSVFAPAIRTTAEEFDTSEEVTLLGISLFVLGFALGPMLWGPLSEMFGRKSTILSAYFMMGLLQIPIALSPTLAGILTCRLLAGCFGAAPPGLVSASFSDFWDPASRGIATAIYSAAVFMGPTLGPVVGSFVTESHLGWRWTAWLVLIMVGVTGIPAWLLVPETCARVLKERAARKQGLPTAKKNMLEGFVREYLSRPILMLIHEPMLDVMTLYIAAVYAILYLTFFAFPYAFAERGWSLRLSSLSFLSMLVGIIVSSYLLSIYARKYYRPRLVARGEILPEDRLPPVMLGSLLLPAGLFWFAWTSSPNTSWIPQIMSGFFIGSGIMLIFSQGLVYIVDVYGPATSASAISANCLIRSVAAAGLPLAAPSMYQRLGTAWATSTLGFICVALVPAPIIFYRYGATLRKMSKFAPTNS